MGQCLSLAKPIVNDVLTDLANQQQQQNQEGKPSDTKTFDVSSVQPSSSPPQAQPSSQQQPSPPAGAWGKPPTISADTTSPSVPQSTPSVPVSPPPSTSSTSGAIHPSLPKDAEQHTVRNVYDGDTLTLVDERRVRLLGIDTPEIKENQPYAQEAKAYTKDRCHKKDIWLSYEASGEKEDHYGRLLCFVWVRSDDGNGYLCINEGIVEAGFATAYHPGRGKTLHNWDHMLTLQSSARNNKRGLWENFVDFKVVKTANGSAYHKRSCEHISSVRNLTEMMSSEAVELGLHPCRTCLS